MPHNARVNKKPDPHASVPPGVRLQKYMADCGVASRRRAEEWIAAGLVRVNGVEVREMGVKVHPGHDVVTCRGRRLEPERRTRTLVLHKPRGYCCTRAGGEGRTVFDLLQGVPEKVEPVGRLDRESEGLLLLTNDGDLLYRWTHPRFEHEKIYRVTVEGTVNAEVLAALRRPMDLDGYTIRPVDVRLLQAVEKPGRKALEFRLREGRNRQIRRMCAAVNLKVRRLVRERIGPLRLGGLPPGAWRDLGADELRRLTEEGRTPACPNA